VSDEEKSLSICSASADFIAIQNFRTPRFKRLLDRRDLRLDFDVCFMGFSPSIVKKPVFLVQKTALILQCSIFALAIHRCITL
jgi:hypothetical protein